MSGETAAERPTGKCGRWLKIALALSLVLNICFVAGPFLWHEVGPSPAQRFHRAVIRKLDLSTDQRQAFTDFVTAMRQARHQLHDGNEPLAGSVWNEEAKAAPDQAAISQLIAKADENHRQFLQAASTALATFMASLRPEQRAAFVELVKNRRNRVADQLWHTLVP